ncbi:hypothetical protein ACFQT0_30095 [Hymenobacter humi]|uniref:Uncharacterized protein n=1 Tax=Hymenobacter humi TaxID=1411620 RepID=A0ABW2UG58_9BACT
MRPEDLSWISTYVFPLLVQGGVRRFARLEAEDPQIQRVVGLVQEIVEQQLPFEPALVHRPGAGAGMGLRGFELGRLKQDPGPSLA